MRYYGRTVDNPKAPNYGEVLDVGRWYDNDEGDIALERWVDGEWTDWPALIEASGIGGSNPFMPMTENDVKRWMRNRGQEWEA